MYRQYEDPYKVEQMLEEARERLAESCGDDGEYDVDLMLWVQELEDRVNYAWQDNEYDCDNYDYADEMWMYENVWG